MTRLIRLDVSLVSGSPSLASSGCGVRDKLAVAVSQAGTHTLRRSRRNGGVWCWGDNATVELGDGTTASRSVPVEVSGLSSGATAVSTDTFNSCALTTAGAVLCWGANWAGQLGSPTIAGAAHRCRFRVSRVGSQRSLRRLASPARSRRAAASCVGEQTTGVSSATARRWIAWCPWPVSGLSSGIAAISASGYHVCAVTTGGAALCWGNNVSGALGDGTSTDSLVPVAVSGLSSGVAAITAGLAHTCALTTGGGVLCWGNNPHGELGDGSLTDSNLPVAVFGLSSGVIEISAGASTPARGPRAVARVLGRQRACGELGNGATTDSSVPVAVSGLSSGVAAIAAGGTSTCAVTTNGSIKCWGDNGYFQLGYGAGPGSNHPVSVLGFGPEAVPALGAAGLVLLSATLIATVLAREARGVRREAER